MSRLIKEIQKQASTTYTENGAIAVSTTLNANLDLFAMGGAMRTRLEDVVYKFSNAASEDLITAFRNMFYIRDIRGAGVGEREVFRKMLKFAANNYQESLIKNLDLIAKYGRYDDLVYLISEDVDKKVRNAVIKLVKNQLRKDIKSKNPSLLGKWMPSINTSSRKTVEHARYVAKMLNYSESIYRKTLSKLRKNIKIVETLLSQKRYSEIEYEKVPSRAMSIYSQAFGRNDSERFSDYIENVKSGKAKINTSTLYPYDIIEKLRVDQDMANTLWKNLPDYVDKDVNVLVMPDVSGSMLGRPMNTSIGLAIYFAERNEGLFKDTILSFTDVPRLTKINREASLAEKYKQIDKRVGYSTNIELAFKTILNAAIKSNCPKEEMPKALLIISDMEFDSYDIKGSDMNFSDAMRRRFNESGYEMPILVFWNVDSRNDTMHAFEDSKDVILVSGQSINTFKNVTKMSTTTPLEYMREVLSQYEDVQV